MHWIRRAKMYVHSFDLGSSRRNNRYIKMYIYNNYYILILQLDHKLCVKIFVIVLLCYHDNTIHTLQLRSPFRPTFIHSWEVPKKVKMKNISRLKEPSHNTLSQYYRISYKMGRRYCLFLLVGRGSVHWGFWLVIAITSGMFFLFTNKTFNVRECFVFEFNFFGRRVFFEIADDVTM